MINMIVHTFLAIQFIVFMVVIMYKNWEILPWFARCIYFGMIAFIVLCTGISWYVF